MMPSFSIATRRMLAPALAIGFALSGAPAVLAEVQPGKPAPEFTARDSTGKEIKLSSLRGKTVVLEWTNHLCPYTVKHYETGNMQSLQKDAAKEGIVWLTVASSAPGMQGHVNALEADKLTADRNAAPASVLLDPDGTVGRLYEARTTPHMFVIDPEGKLAYMGAIDDKPTANAADVKAARNYVREALDAMKSGTPVKSASTRPYGCTVKYPPARS